MRSKKVRNIHILKIQAVWMTQKSIPPNFIKLSGKPIVWNSGDYYGRLSISRPRGITHA